MIDRAQIENCSRILILGGPGTGKSTFARFLGKKLNLEVIHLDKHYHKAGWEPRERDEFHEIVRAFVKKDRWVIDGNYSGTLSMRIARADLIFVLDYSSIFCVYRVLKRNFKTRLGIETRSDIPEDCYEGWLNPGFLKFTWNYKRDYIPKGRAILEESGFDKNKILLYKNHKEFRKFFKSIEE